jgi:hypothetical protein
VSGRRYIVVQNGSKPAYLCAWVGDGTWIREGIREVPVFLYERDQALTFDETTARQIVDRLDARYRLMRHFAEELLPP